MSRCDFTTKVHSESYDSISLFKLDLTGRKILVTGCAWSSCVDYATATAFAEAGASAVAVVDLHGASKDLESDLKPAALEAGHPDPTHTIDISRPERVRTMLAVASKALKRELDLLPHNAAH